MHKLQMDFKLEDSTGEKIPEKLEKIVKKILSINKSPDLTQRDIFVTMIMYIIYENGFTLVTNSASDSEILNMDEVIYMKQSSGKYEVTLKMPGFNDINLKLILLPLGTTLLIDIFINYCTNCEVYTVCLPVNQYINFSETIDNLIIFNDFEQLSHTIKNKIINPAKSSVLTYFGYSCASLIGLPEELFLNILIYLPITDIVSIAKTCRRFNILLNNQNFWHALFKRDFKEKEHVHADKDWKSSYRDEYSRKLAQKTSCNLSEASRDISNNLYTENPFLLYFYDYGM